jgi:hypothetical protein
MFPLPPPLRTVRDDFSSYGSSLSNAPYGTRFHHLYLLAMNLLMAIWMEQHTVFHTVLSAFQFPHDVMVRPSRRFGYLLLTYWTEAILLFPEEKDFPSSQERIRHLDPKTLLKIRLP